MPSLQHVPVALCRVLAVCVCSKLMRCRSIIEDGKLALEAGQPARPPAVFVPSATTKTIARKLQVQSTKQQKEEFSPRCTGATNTQFGSVGAQVSARRYSGTCSDGAVCPPGREWGLAGVPCWGSSGGSRGWPGQRQQCPASRA